MLAAVRVVIVGALVLGGGWVAPYALVFDA
jgi:hypothetical protein